MGFADRFNKGKKIDWKVNTEGWEFKKCKDMTLNTVFPMKGCYVTKDNGYGEGGVIIANGYMVNAPQSFVATIKELMADEEAIQYIIDGHMGFEVQSFVSDKFKRTGYRIVLTDM